MCWRVDLLLHRENDCDYRISQNISRTFLHKYSRVKRGGGVRLTIEHDLLLKSIISNQYCSNLKMGVPLIIECDL